jgi:hypothetical protein
MTNLFFMTYGKYADERSKQLNRTLLARGDVLNIGLKDQLKDPKVVPEHESEDGSDQTSVNGSSLKSSIDSEESFHKEKEKSRAHLRKAASKGRFKNLSGVTIREKRNPGFFAGYIHALKKTHNFFSIVNNYNTKLSRSLRFFLYFIRFYAMLAVGSIFFTQTRVLQPKLFYP